MTNKTLHSSLKLLLAGVLAIPATTALAGGTIEVGENKSISVGLGLRASFKAVNDAAPSGDAPSKDFGIESARIYLSGQAAKDTKFTFNTEEIDGTMKVLDGIIQYEPGKSFNVWAGRMLTPADRIEMNGPFYGLSWNQYNVPLFPSDQNGEAGLRGRDEGVTVWGSISKFQYALGVFDGYTGPANEDDNLLYAARFAYNFLNMEQNPGYYTSSTYYGGLGDIFTVALSVQQQTDGVGAAGDSADFMGYAIDFLFEKGLGNHVLTLEGEYKVFDADVSAAAAAAEDNFVLFNGDSYFATAAFLLGNQIGKGKVQPYVRYTSQTPDGGDESTTTELGLNYVLDGHNSRLNAHFIDGDDIAAAFAIGMQQQF